MEVHSPFYHLPQSEDLHPTKHVSMDHSLFPGRGAKIEERKHVLMLLTISD